MPRRDAGEPFPAAVRTGAILWIAYGALGLVSAVANLALPAANGNPATPICSFLIAIAFLVTGIQTVVGKVSDVMGAGIASIALGLLTGGAGIVMLTFRPAVPGGAAAVILVIVGLLALMLIASGFLVIAGRRAYLDWRADAGYGPRGKKKKKKKRPIEAIEVDEEEVDDDRPRPAVRVEIDDEDDRPRKRRPIVEDDEDDRPRRRRNDD